VVFCLSIFRRNGDSNAPHELRPVHLRIPDVTFSGCNSDLSKKIYTLDCGISREGIHSLLVLL
jgi:hypothetical protein